METGQAVGAIIDALLKILGPVYIILAVAAGSVVLARTLDLRQKARRRAHGSAKKQDVRYKLR